MRSRIAGASTSLRAVWLLLRACFSILNDTGMIEGSLSDSIKNVSRKILIFEVLKMRLMCLQLLNCENGERYDIAFAIVSQGTVAEMQCLCGAASPGFR